MTLLTLGEAKQYLRVDSDAEDFLIESLVESAEGICAEVARLETGELPGNIPVFRAASLYALAYLYEHREEADHHGLMLTLRAILFAFREYKF